MKASCGSGKRARIRWRVPLLAFPVVYFLVEVFAFAYLREAQMDLWPLAFGGVWAVLLTAIVCLLPQMAGRIFFGISYFLLLLYTGAQTGYYILFGEMMWISDFRYASEGSEFFSVLLQYPLGWWLSILALAALGVVMIWRFPRVRSGWQRKIIAGLVAVAAAVGAWTMPQAVFQHDLNIQYAGSDYGRSQSSQAAYENMFNTHRLYEVCGVAQTAVKDLWRDHVAPLLPSYAMKQSQAVHEIDAWFEARGKRKSNLMTGMFQGKNVIFVLMESMDDFALGEHTPTINRLMKEGISFNNFYTPGYGGVRTFNSEFCANTGTFLSSSGGYAFDYVTNSYKQSLASVLREAGYSAKVYHYNTPDFYSRGVFSPAMGYEEYVCYENYVTEENEKDLYSDQFLFDYQAVSDDFFRDGKTLNFIITRSAHLSYKYNEVLSYWGLKQFPEFKGMTGDEELDCLYLKAKLVDDMFDRLLLELEVRGQLENTVIIAMTDHYAYGFKNEELMLEQSGVEDVLLLEKTPCFIWSADGFTLNVEKTMNTADLLPTVLNLLGVDSKYDYLGQDVFDSRYAGYALFPDGSWVCDGVAYSSATEAVHILKAGKTVTPERMEEMAAYVNDFVRINNLILDTNYYKGK